jgi:glutathione peroxidase
MGMIFDLLKKGNYVDNPYKNFYEISARDINKYPISMEKFKNKVILVTNFNPFDKNLKDSYEKLIELKENLGEDFEILAFPSSELDKINSSDKEIKEKILSNEYINMEKINIFNRVYLNGDEISEVYKYCQKNSGYFRVREGTAKPIEENFVKFLIDKNGKVHSHYNNNSSNSKDNVLLEDAKKLLEQKVNNNISIRNDFTKFDKYI